MIFKDDQEAIDFVRHNQDAPKHVVFGREQRRELFALIEGDGFLSELINKIEHIESKEKAKARKKYSRSIIDLYERLLNPIGNVFSATGGSKKYEVGPESRLKDFLNKASRLRDGKSVQKYVETTWMPLYHSDPNGVIFMEYTTKQKHGKDDVYPTYKSIDRIRNYIPRGQLCEAILFEPKNVKVFNTEGLFVGKTIHWRLVDDAKEYTIKQEGNTFTVVQDLTFEHPFGQVPAIINSDIIKIGTVEFKVSPIHKIKELTKEYARDQSIKTLYKFLQGFPTHWRYVTECKVCHGVGKTGENNGTINARKNCPDCDGKGFYMKKDVTDMVTLNVPTSKDDVKLAPDIAGFVSPDLETWGVYTGELELLENLAEDTHWGTHKEKGVNETATARFIDVQPVMKKLNKYADVAEWVEKKLSEWVFLFMFPGTKEFEINVHYGRRYIIESPDVILAKYQEARKNGANNIVLDRLFNEFLTAKYGDDPQWLRVELLKSQVEPWLHMSIVEVNDIFGRDEAIKKSLFTDWWKTLNPTDLLKDANALKTDYDAWLKLQTIEEVPNDAEPPNNNK
jgi:hypothetical protein